MINTLRSSENQAESVSLLADSKLKEAQDLFAQAKLMRSGADRDPVQAMKSVQELKTKLEASQSQFRALYNAIFPVLASIGQQGDNQLNLGDLIPLIPSHFYDFVKSGFHRCINNVVAYVRVLAPDAPLERLAETTVTAEFTRQVEVAKVDLRGLTDQVLEQMNVLPPPPPPPAA